MISASGGGSSNIIQGSSSLDDVQFTADGKTMIYTGAKRVASRMNCFAPLQRRRAGGADPLERRPARALSLTPLEEMSVESTDKTRSAPSS